MGYEQDCGGGKCSREWRGGKKAGVSCIWNANPDILTYYVILVVNLLTE